MDARILHFYLPPWLHDRVARPASIFGRVKQAADLAGWQMVLHGEDEPPAMDGYHLLDLTRRRVSKAADAATVVECLFEKR